MKKTTVAFLIAAVTAGFSGVTQAEGPPGQPQFRHQAQGGHDARSDRGGPRGDSHHDERRHDDRHYASRDSFAWQGQDFRRGHRLPAHFDSAPYRVNDWRDRGLGEPPRGQHWAYIDGNYVLIAAATGVITSILLHNAL
ncbi:RcnB family protein [Erwinia sp. 9145]|uniref:RcnB family protein n=1 Tax=Erwinia sp. 9145 TaxID=1500895 RepID=UPI0005542E71|nr:RcnB family protein [Erwinia sp. 9145]